MNYVLMQNLCWTNYIPLLTVIPIQINNLPNPAFKMIYVLMYLKIHVPFPPQNQIERFIRIGIPPAIRGRVWKCLLNIDSLRAASSFDYEVQPHQNIYLYY